MMSKSRNRKQVKENQKQKRKMSAKYYAGGGASKYARKRAYLNKTGLWGWEVADKPW